MNNVLQKTEEMHRADYGKLWECASAGLKDDRVYYYVYVNHMH